MHRFSLLLGLAVSLAIPSSASAQTFLPAPVAAAPDARTKAQAKRAFMQAKKYFKAGKYEKAAELYAKADGLVPAPTPKFYIAQAWDKARKVPEAIAAYKAFIEAGSSDKERYGEKLSEAEARLKVLVPQTQAQVTIVLDPPVEGASVDIDGTIVEGGMASLDPGTYTLTIRAPGYQTQTKDIEVIAEGVAGEGLFVVGLDGSLTVTLEEEAAAAPPPPPEPMTEPDDGEGMGLLIPGVIVGGVGLVGVGVGAAFGTMALGSASDFEETPTEELADDAESQALISDLGLIIGGVAVAAGITMIVIDLAGGDSTEEQAFTVVPMVGPETQGVSTVVRF